MFKSLVQLVEPVRFYLQCILIIFNLSANKYMFKVNNRNTRKMFEICSKLTIKTTTSLPSFCCLYCKLWTYLTPFSILSMVYFEQANVYLNICYKWWDIRVHSWKRHRGPLGSRKKVLLTSKYYFISLRCIEKNINPFLRNIVKWSDTH